MRVYLQVTMLRVTSSRNNNTLLWRLIAIAWLMGADDVTMMRSLCSLRSMCLSVSLLLYLHSQTHY